MIAGGGGFVRTRHRRMARWRALALVVATACSDGTGPSDPTPDPTPYVVGAALANLQQGRFQLPEPGPSAVPMIDRARAEALARAWAISFGPALTDALTQEHGGPVQPAALQVCATTRFAESQFETVDPAVAADLFRAPTVRALGPQWLVQLCAPSGELQVALAVAAYATDLGIEHGYVVLPSAPVGGNWFSSLGTPRGVAPSFPIGPEEAVVLVARATERRVTEVPRLMLRTATFRSPLTAAWQVRLDAPVTVHESATGAPQAASELYVLRDESGRVRLSVAASEQPATSTQTYLVFDTINQPPNPPQIAEFTLTRRADVPVLFTEVTAPGPVGP